LVRWRRFLDLESDMSIHADSPVNTEQLIEGLTNADAYRHAIDGDIEVHETHISIVFLAGEFAFKIKKATKNNFLDYSTLELRKHYCEEERRLGVRYADDLYLSVVPIGWEHERLQVETIGDPIEYAVKMRRFPAGALLSERIEAGLLTTDEVLQLAEKVADIHRKAAICDPQFAAGWPDFLVKNMHQIVSQLQSKLDLETAATLKTLHRWSDTYFQQYLPVFADRAEAGFIRECHGDLHLQNVVHWGDRLIPFDGIEFNEHLRWIDVLSDVAFLIMDFAARGHLDLSRSLMNAYLERTNDYDSILLIRWFLVYRSLIRALAASMRAEQSHLSSSEREAEVRESRQHVGLAYRYSRRKTPHLWITHGVSGSGKTMLSEAIIHHHDALRLRSDIHRKRIFGLKATERPTAELRREMYSEATSHATYAVLHEKAAAILYAGYNVIVDATFLKLGDRETFHDLAKRQHALFAILDCHSDEQTLRQRVADRMAKNEDASDADLHVLEQQLASYEPLLKTEREYVVDVPDLAELADHL
jgi:aminoglycoside phosphotransferase family enzyme/predicted kinase